MINENYTLKTMTIVKMHFIYFGKAIKCQLNSFQRNSLFDILSHLVSFTINFNQTSTKKQLRIIKIYKLVLNML